MAFVSGCRDPERPMEPEPPTSFVPGSKIKPTKPLVEWLEKEAGARRKVRLPVVIEFEDAHRLAVGRAFVGVTAADAESDPLFLHLDDTTLGISLMDRLRSRFPKDVLSAAFWIEGYWGSPLPSDLLPSRGDRRPFTVRKLGERIGPNEDVRAMIEAPR